ncbi:MAG: hypothetical protein FJW23_11175 [Acidimicrobiia bacterium]|nr:hypothetical protein [Acidimicrobiia bacterium]
MMTMWNQGCRTLLACCFAAGVVGASAAGAAEPRADNAPGGTAEPRTPGADAEAQAQPESIDELRRRVEILAEEVERLRSGEADDEIELTEGQRQRLGVAPSAAATYRRRTAGVSLAGYGEMLLENYAAENESGAGGAPTTRIDFLRAILYAGYRFNDRFVFNSEIEVEHASEIFVEFAYVDYLANDNLTFRGGMVLLPLGLVNEFHEPNVFIGARRPETESRILPSTWRENGGGILGSAGPINFRAYVVNGLNGAAFNASGTRGGRQKGISARAANLAVAGRIDVTPTPGVFAGIGMYRGGSGQEAVVYQGERLDMMTSIVELHGQAQWRGFDLRGLFAHATVDDARQASLALGLPAGAPIAEAMRGGYVQVGYDLLSQFSPGVAVMPYVRLETVDTQHRVPAGFTRDRSRDGRFTTLGVDVKPIPNVVIKMDYQFVTNEANSGRNQFDLALGYAF